MTEKFINSPFYIETMPSGVYIRTEFHKEKLRGPRPNISGDKHPMWGIKGKDNPRFGTHHSESSKDKIRKKALGRHPTEESKQKNREKHLGKIYNPNGTHGIPPEKHPSWKGGKDSFIHKWARENVPKPELCPLCNSRPPTLVHSISGEHKKEISDWVWVCPSSHMKIHRVNVKHGHFSKPEGGFNSRD